MTDIKTIEERSRNMAAIKGKNTKPEQYICHELYHRGFRYRKNVNYVTGHPDIYLAKYNTAIFVNGCFGIDMKDVNIHTLQKAGLIFGEKNLRLM